MSPIKHVWFDFSDTIAGLNQAHYDYLHQTYAEAVGKPLTDAVVQELKAMREKYKSYGAVFTTGLGFPKGYWSEKVLARAEEFYSLKHPDIPNILNSLRQRRPLSMFSNLRVKGFLPKLGINSEWFTHFISSADIAYPKPALDGFVKAVELSELPAENLLFIGDDVEKELVPAKTVGMQTGLVWSESKEADYSFPKFEDILRII